MPADDKQVMGPTTFAFIARITLFSSSNLQTTKAHPKITEYSKMPSQKKMKEKKEKLTEKERKRPNSL